MRPHWTEQDYEQVRKNWVRGGVTAPGIGGVVTKVDGVTVAVETTRSQGGSLAPSPFAPEANKWERNYSYYLDLQQHAGEILSWQYGRVTFRLAKGQYHRIDFIAQRHDGRIQMDQVKGWHPNLRAAIKGLKWAAQLWPMFYWTITKWNGSGWESTDVEV